MLQVLTITIDYSALQSIRGEGANALSDERYLELSAMFPEMELYPIEDRAKSYPREFIGTVDDCEKLLTFGIKPEIKRIRGMWSEALPKLDALGAASASPPSIVNITVAGSALFGVQTVRVEEDVCTDILQSLLDEGWRIVAVCPPNDCRRPTYILGHQNAKMPRR